MNSYKEGRAVFMGTPSFVIPVLSALLDSDYDVVGVYTQPDRPIGRNKRLAAPPVKQFAIEMGLRVFQPTTLKNEGTQRKLEALCPDIVIVAAYRLFLPSKILRTPKWGCLNIHPSLLPRYRGSSPVVEAILNGDRSTGVTVMKIDEGMDTGPVIAQQNTLIDDQESATELTVRLFEQGASLLMKILPDWTAGSIQGISQDESKATLTTRLTKGNGEIDWTNDAETIARQIRAYKTWPGTYTRWNGKQLKIIEASVSKELSLDSSGPGRVASLIDGGVGVITGHGVIKLRSLQLEGKREVATLDFTLGHSAFIGSTLG